MKNNSTSLVYNEQAHILMGWGQGVSPRKIFVIYTIAFMHFSISPPPRKNIFAPPELISLPSVPLSDYRPNNEGRQLWSRKLRCFYLSRAKLSSPEEALRHTATILFFPKLKEKLRSWFSHLQGFAALQATGLCAYTRSYIVTQISHYTNGPQPGLQSWWFLLLTCIFPIFSFRFFSSFLLLFFFRKFRNHFPIFRTVMLELLTSKSKHRPLFSLTAITVRSQTSRSQVHIEDALLCHRGYAKNQSALPLVTLRPCVWQRRYPLNA